MKTVASVSDPIFESADELAAEPGIRSQISASVLSKPEPEMSVERCLEMIAATPLRPQRPWEALKEMTRDP